MPNIQNILQKIVETPQRLIQAGQRTRERIEDPTTQLTPLEIILSTLAGPPKRQETLEQPQPRVNINLISKKQGVSQALQMTTPLTPHDPLIENIFGNDANDMKRVLRYRDAQGNIKGENTNFQTGREVDIPNRDGSIDRGLYRINSNTFADFMNRKPEVLRRNGITNWNDMLNVEKNIRMAKIIFDEQGFNAWFAAPPDLRTR